MPNYSLTYLGSGTYIANFMDYCKAHNVRVDVLSWHESGVDSSTPDLIDHLRAVHERFIDNPAYKSVGVQKIEINEMVGKGAQYRPGELLGYL